MTPRAFAAYFNSCPGIICTLLPFYGFVAVTLFCSLLKPGLTLLSNFSFSKAPLNQFICSAERPPRRWTPLTEGGCAGVKGRGSGVNFDEKGVTVTLEDMVEGFVRRRD